MCVPSSSGGRPPQAPLVVSTRGARSHLHSPNRALWASPSPPVGLRLGDLRGGPRLAAGPRLGGRTCPRQLQLASQLLNFPSRALRPPLRQHPCLGMRSAHPHLPLARGGRVVCLLCSPSQSGACLDSASFSGLISGVRVLSPALSGGRPGFRGGNPISIDQRPKPRKEG